MDKQPVPTVSTLCARGDYFVVPRILVAAVLLVAATLKIYQLSTGLVRGSGLLANRWVSLAEADFEIVLALWLLSGCYRRLVWLVTLACFVTFSGITASKHFAGAASCGCFGAVQVPPLATLLLDVSLVLMLLFLRPRPRPAGESHRRGLRAGVVVAAIAVIATAIPVIRYSPSRLGRDGNLIGTDRTVLLEPEEWVGQPLPIAKHIDIADELSRGDWTVVLVHTGCEECRAVVGALADKAKALCPGEMAKIALIQLPPYGDAMKELLADDLLFLVGRLDESGYWFVQTPVFLRLRDGQVTAVQTAQDEEDRDTALAQAVPVIPVAETEYDFGPVAAGSVHAMTFKIGNPSSGSLKIRRVVSESACLRPKSCPKRIGPYSFGLVEVELVTPSKSSVRHPARILIETDDPVRPTIALTVLASAGR